MRSLFCFIAATAATAMAVPSSANDWEKFYTPIAAAGEFTPYEANPEKISSTGDMDRDLELMWRRGFAPIGYSSFSSGNSKTKDAERFAKKLGARYLIVATDLTSSNTASLPITTPTSTTSYTNGTASVFGSRGTATGTYSGTTTTYGTATTYIPFTINRFDKFAVYFSEVPRKGTGILIRELTAQEMAALESRRAFVVKFVRDASPAFYADILPGDIIVKANGQPADPETWQNQLQGAESIQVELIRNVNRRNLVISIPEEWRS